jgi:alpha-mannosidase
MKRLILLVTVSLALLGGAWAQMAKPGGPDLTKQPTLYVVGYAHLDTQWRWEYPTTIGEYILNTMRANFALFEKYPHYIFNFSGANRYRMMKEYFPADYAKVKQYVAAGRWFPSGSSMEENDVNSPSAESLIRQILYGKEYFRKEFGKTSAEFELPDCFGFPASLPSILAHTGLKGFSTQKLSWGSSVAAGGPNSPEKTPPGMPFNVGIWEGPDGKSVMAAMNPGDYSGGIYGDLTKSPGPAPAPDPNYPMARLAPRELDWVKRVQIDGAVSGVFADYHYFGTGDIGGAPDEPSVKLLEAIVTRSKTVIPFRPGRLLDGRPEPPPAAPRPEVQVGDGSLHVVSATAEQMFLDIKPGQMGKLPRYKGELELTNHSAGSITSEAYLKRWNHRNELLADAAEEASVAAEWLGGRPYPLERLTNAWTLVMGGQFHDIVPGTATPKAF